MIRRSQVESFALIQVLRPQQVNVIRRILVTSTTVQMYNKIMPLSVGTLVSSLLRRILMNQRVDEVRAKFLIGRMAVGAVMLNGLRRLIDRQVNTINALTLGRILVNLFSSIITEVRSHHGQLHTVLIHSVNVYNVQRVRHARLGPFLDPIELNLLIMRTL